MKNEKDKVIVALYVRGNDLIPEDVTKKLGVTPTHSQRRGEKKMTPSNSEYVTKIGLWGLLSISESTKITDHIVQLASNIIVNGDVIRGIHGVQEAYVDIFVAASADQDHEGAYAFDLSVESMAALNRIGLPVRFTLNISNE